MRREVDARARWPRQPRPEAVQPHERVVGEPAADIFPKLPVVLEAHAGGFDVDVAVHELEIQAPEAALRVLARGEIEKAHCALLMPNRVCVEKRALR